MTVSSNFTRWLTEVCRAAAQIDFGHSFYDETCEPAVDSDRVALLREQLEQQVFFRRLMEMTCVEVMRVPVMSVTDDQSIGRALALLNKQRIKLLPVIDARARLIGVVTRADLQPLHPSVRQGAVERSAIEAAERERRRSPVRSVMSTEVTTVNAATKVAEVIPRFTARGHHHIPVVLDDAELVGMLTQSDIVAIMCRGKAV
ncbi:CBS domain-containing protein [Caballeronia telluris]|uniref:HPP family protein n=1 Tax=Caballeronia telluris TaxID=326475 RepID=A0A158KAL2_9BURK|nr:CBS domain-containing protein [Caballeronia telluris]SAL77580.1 HPP family protein [Caballeronia telluris]